VRKSALAGVLRRMKAGAGIQLNEHCDDLPVDVVFRHDTQPFCWIMSGAHSAFHTRTAFSLSDDSILLWMRRMIDMEVLLARMARGNRNWFWMERPAARRPNRAKRGPDFAIPAQAKGRSGAWPSGL